MNLVALRTAMVAAATGVDIKDVYFDFKTVSNTQRNKAYPYVMWLIDTADGKKQVRSTGKHSEMTMTVFAVNTYTPDADRLPLWDALLDDLDNYLIALNTSTYVSVDLEDVKFDLYPPGFVSVDRELAISYKITLTLWC